MSNGRLIVLFFCFVILCAVSFSLGVSVGKRLAGEETQVVVKEKAKDPWALSRESTDSEEEPEEGGPAYQTPSPVPTATAELSEETAEPGGTAGTSEDEFAEESLNEQAVPSPKPEEKQEGSAEEIPASPEQPEEGTETVAEEKQPPSEETQPEEEETASAPPLAQPEGRYTVQIGSFKIEGQAKKVSETLKSKGYAAFVSMAEIPGSGTWYRVRVGTFQTKEEAELYGEDIKSREPLVETALVTVNN